MGPAYRSIAGAGVPAALAAPSSRVSAANRKAVCTPINAPVQEQRAKTTFAFVAGVAVTDQDWGDD
jgi:hypothetical protein